MRERLTHGEQQIMDVVYRDSPCTVQHIETATGITYSAARSALARLVDKKVLKSRYDGPRYVYTPVKGLSKARMTALKDLVSNLFHGSTVDAMGALLAMSKDTIDDEDLAHLAEKIRQAREEQE